MVAHGQFSHAEARGGRERGDEGLQQLHGSERAHHLPPHHAKLATGVVDAVRKAHDATATVFVKDGDEFVRVSTNVLTPEGKRGVGTQLARNKAYDALAKGDAFCGPVDVLGTAYDACYNPIRDATGKVVGVSYIGHKR